jgi:4-amino-4-deoxy-L-arabinose transferase-like glycosyltransferase
MKTPQTPLRHLPVWASIVIVLLLGFSLRIWQLDAQPLSGDEAFSILNWTRVSLTQLLKTVAIKDPQPPATLLSLYMWVRLVGDTEFSARMLSVLSSTITIASTYALGRQLIGRRAALLTAFLVATNPFQIWYAQDIRSYSLWIAASITSLTLLVRSFRAPARTRNWALYVISASLAAYTFYLEVFMLLAHNFYALSRILSTRDRQLLITWIKAQASIAIVLAPWYIYVAVNGQGYRPTAGDPAILTALRTLLFGTTIPDVVIQTVSLPLAISVLAIALLIAGISYIWHAHPHPTAILLTATSLLPVCALAFLAAVTGHGYFHPRYVAASSVPVLMLVGASLTPHNPIRPSTRTATRMLGISLLLISFFISMMHYRSDPAFAKAPPWREIMRLLDAQIQPSDLILRNYPDPAFDYYYLGSADAFILPRYQGAPASDTIQEIESAANQYTHIWFIPVESRVFDSDALVLTWLDANMDFISEQWVGPTRIRQYANPEYLQPEIALDSPANFGDTILLLGYRATPSTALWGPDTTIYLELFWQPLVRTQIPLKIFVHLLGPMQDGTPLWSQDDQLPKDGRSNSMTWQPNQIFRDVYQLTIPTSAPSGDYYITVGLYSETTGSRVAPLSTVTPLESDAALIIQFSIP